ncbi:MAG: ABC transporter substrate-binding protein [Desulfobacterales bacterium]|nr:MAG: ABC transporter substrate-binding protein [Desulfobacterales bacterium]
MKRFLKTIGLLTLIFGLCLTLSTNTSRAASDKINVGVMYSITGKGSEVAKVQLDGVNLAIKQVNEKGGLEMDGKKVEVEAVVRDDETKPDVAVRRLRELIDENIRVVVGGTFAHVSTALNEQIRDGQALFMATNGIQEKVFRKENKAPYYISPLGAVDGIGRMCADYVGKTFKPQHVILFLPDYAYGRGAAEGAHKVFGSKYPDIKVTEVWSPVGTPDFTSYIIKIKELKPDVVMMGHWGNDAINALKQVYELGLRKDAKVFFNSIITAFAVGIPPEALEGVTMGWWWYHDLTGIKDPETEKAVAELTEVWKKEYGEPPDPFAVYAYLGMQQTLRGIELANSLEPGKVYQALLDNPQFMSVKGPATWRVDGRPSYKYAKFIADGKPPQERKDKWDVAKVVDVYMGEELCLPLKEMGWE